jgi:hypothetical protein
MGCGFTEVIVEHRKIGDQEHAICEYCRAVPEGDWMFPPKGVGVKAHNVPKETLMLSTESESAGAAAVPEAARWIARGYCSGWWSGFGSGALLAAAIALAAFTVACLLGWVRI